MRRLVPLFALTCIALAAVALLLLRGDGLPETFTMHISADLTSSGSSRIYEATLYGSSHSLTGTSSYVSDPGTGEREAYSCSLTQGIWLDSLTNEPCPIPTELPSDRRSLATAVAEGTLVPLASCTHRQLCYEILQ